MLEQFRSRLGSGCAPLTLILAASLASTVAQAQAPSVPGPPTPASPSTSQTDSTNTVASSTTNNGTQVEEIVVTAQKRRENLQNVPIAITAVTATSLSRLGVTGTTDLQTVVPGFQASQVLSASTPSIRGIGGGDNEGSSEGSVALYVDGVYYSSQSSGIFDFSNVDRVEVLKGPQGTLFGRNATAGVVNVITLTPSETPSGKVSVGYGNYDTLRSTGYLTGGLTSGVAADISYVYANQGDGYGRNLYDGAKVDRSDEFGLRSKLYVTLVPKTQITVAADYLNQKSDAGSAFVSTTSPGPYTVDDNLQPSGSIESFGVSLRVEHEFDFAKLVSITAYRHVNTDVVVDQDRTPAPIVNASIFSPTRAFTQEAQLVSNPESKLKWVVGVFYMNRAASVDPQIIGGLAVAPEGLSTLDVYGRQTTKSLSEFVQATYPILPDTNLTLGGRYTSDTQYKSGGAVLNLLPPLNLAIPMSDPNDGRKLFTKPTYRVALDHRIGDILGYASIDRSFKSGYFNLEGFPSSSVAPEILTSYQIGVKTDLFNKRLRINADGFLYDYTNFQFIEVENGASLGVNAGQAHEHGADFDVTAVPVRDLNLSIGATWLPYARYNKFDPCPNATLATQSCDGSRLVRAPKLSMTLGADYTKRTSVGNFVVSGSYNYSSSFLWEPQLNLGAPPAYGQKAFGVGNTQVSWNQGPHGISVTAYVKNLADKHYGVFGDTDVFGNFDIPAPPRTFGVTLAASF